MYHYLRENSLIIFLLLAGAAGFLLIRLRVLSEKLRHEVNVRMENEKKLRLSRKELEERVKERTQELEETNEKLKELDRMKTNFISNISHELRTPLASIKGFSETIFREKDMDGKIRHEFLSIIQEETEKLTKLINRLLNLSVIEMGKIRLKKREIDLTEEIDEVLRSCRTQARLKMLTLESNLAGARLPVFADPLYIKEAICQLLDNAIKYTKAEGKVGLYVQDQSEQVLITVSDNGPGIPAEDVPHIFDKFFKVEHPAEQVGGVGMGLALAKHIVEAHGGVVSVESKVGEGSTFGITLPAALKGDAG